jgi:transketolase
LGPDEIAAARKNLNWPHAPFEIPDNLLTAWRDIGARGRDAYTAWENRLAAADDAVRQAFIEHQSGVNRHALDTAIQKVMNEFTRNTKGNGHPQGVPNGFGTSGPCLAQFDCGSADLTGSNLTKVAAHTVIPAEEQRDESQDLPPDQERMKVPDTRFAGSG